MKNILIRNIDQQTLTRLKALAKRNGTSLQSEVKTILQREARMMTPEEVRQFSLKWRKRFAGRKFSDSAALIRKDRER